MSFFSQEPTRHDFFTSLATLKLSGRFPEAVVECLDGGIPFEDLVAKSSPVINGYKPDAILQIGDATYLVEVKSFNDLLSSHSLQQFEIIREILVASDRFFLYLLIFDCPASCSLKSPLPGLPEGQVQIEIVSH